MQKNKALVSLVFGLGLIIMGGLVLLGYGLSQRAKDPNFSFFKSSDETPEKINEKISNKKSISTADLPKNISIPLAKGARVSRVDVSDDKIVVHIIDEAKRDLILILDAHSGAVIRRIHFDTTP